VAGGLVADLSTPGNVQAQTVAEIVQRTRPDILRINEFDFVEGGVAAQLSSTTTSRSGTTARTRSNTATGSSRRATPGIASSCDLNDDGRIVTTPGAPGYGDDALGFGAFPGQFGMAVYSRYPINYESIRTLQHFLWGLLH
jgi:Endonuclease/Exonuclease/phosphatase family